ncbi:MAG: hypothetical protein FJY92_06650 [Candidatus Hydrogenedentes bacterium]|nr:hypothetical protein [Candidatus Hydrogenedentota bacterium]
MARTRRLVTGWRILALAIVAAIALWSANHRFARTAPARGFYPEGTYCIVSSWDLPRAWEAFNRGDVLARMDEDWPRPYRGPELAVRLSTGIRPTPNRWGLWLGPRAVFALAPEGAGITVHPGHLLRWADALHTALGYGPDAEGIAQYRDYCYAWRDGYLVASTSRGYVAATMNAKSAPRMRSDDSALFTVQWEGEHGGFMNVMPGAGLPVSGQLDFAATDGARALTLPQAWPVQPAIGVTARSVRDAEQAWSALETALEGADWYRALRTAAGEAVRAWGIQPPAAAWADGADHVSFALLDVDTRLAPPMPGLAMAMRFADDAPDIAPVLSVLGGRQTIPFRWNGFDGIVAPVLGSEFSPCVARTRHEWIVTTREPLMAALAGQLADGPACAAETDIALRASWGKIGEVAEAIARELGQNEVVPRMNLDDINADIVPKITALSKLGEIAIDASAHESTLKFSGHLAKAIEGETE